VRFANAAKALLPPLVMSLGPSLFAVLLVRPFFYEAFYIPTNAMAPTIVGVHIEAPCPHCGSSAFGTAPENASLIPIEGWRMICSKEFKQCRVPGPFMEAGQGDRILVNKLLTPRRWDIIVFRYPGDPRQNYVKRLVGMPGEEIVIRDKAVYANGQRLEPPAAIAGIEYLDSFDGFDILLSGTKARPAKLGPGEYFVLGDFSAQSADSRVWETDTLGHPSYAVPESHIIGVVTHIYWPPSRWRAFR
jgi:signal peptidase I